FLLCLFLFFFQAEDGIRDFHVTGVQTCALPISISRVPDCPNRAGAWVKARPSSMYIFLPQSFTTYPRAANARTLFCQATRVLNVESIPFTNSSAASRGTPDCWERVLALPP